ncbi:Swt1 family HEPN domain-containing protein [Clavibacter michiganensis]|uniref:Swt1 family HEPN domain-containing protein n=1 Tax=Clavibacter michiganensis TaxID=28447 RepID=UPI000A3B42F7|nr:Swt1 family HEPN domain-containing protein [Clavibacter michiganensis]
MSEHDALRSFLFRNLMFEAEAEAFRAAGVRVGVDQSSAEAHLLEEALNPFPLSIRNDALRMARVYAIMYSFENAVRDLISSRLSEENANWWDERVPRKIKELAASRVKDAEKNSWLEGASSEILGFVDFGGLSDIIIQNWSLFEDLIPSQHWLKQRLDELERARNFIAHNRMLLPAEFARIDLYVGDWNRQVGI